MVQEEVQGSNEQVSVTVDEDFQVVDEMVDSSDSSPKYIGQCKWFSDKLGYGFLTICDGDKKGTDIFSHHSGIKPLNSNYRTLKKGEYVEFSIVNGMNGLQAVDVTGINGGALMCDFVNPKKLNVQHEMPYQVPHVYSAGHVQPPPPPRRRKVVDVHTEDWQQVPNKRVVKKRPYTPKPKSVKQ